MGKLLLAALLVFAVATPALAQQFSITGNLTATGTSVKLVTGGAANGLVRLINVGTGTYTFQGCVRSCTEEVNWFDIALAPTTGAAATSQATDSGEWTVATPLREFRVFATTHTSGTPTVDIYFTTSGGGGAGGTTGGGGGAPLDPVTPADNLPNPTNVDRKVTYTLCWNATDNDWERCRTPAAGGGGSVTQGTVPWVVSGNVTATVPPDSVTPSDALANPSNVDRKVTYNLCWNSTDGDWERCKIAPSVTQGTSPWVTSGSVTQGTSPWVTSGSVTQGTSPWVVSGAVTQGTSPWVVSGTVGVTGDPVTPSDALANPTNVDRKVAYQLCWNASGSVWERCKPPTPTVASATGTLTAVDQSITVTTGGAANGVVRVNGIGSGTYSFQGCLRDCGSPGNWFGVNGTPVDGGTPVGSTTASGEWIITAALNSFRVYSTVHSSGTPTVDIYMTSSGGGGAGTTGGGGGGSVTQGTSPWEGCLATDSDSSWSEGEVVPCVTDRAGYTKVTVKANGAATHYRNMTASTNAVNIKASAGILYSFTCTNAHATEKRYVAFHNTAGTPTAGSSVFRKYEIPPPGISPYIAADGIAFSTGIAFTVVENPADSDNTAVSAANEVLCNFEYR